MSQEILLSIITILVAVVGYFVKKTLDKTEVIGVDIVCIKPKLEILWNQAETISVNVLDMKPKLEILWKDKIASASSPRQLNERGMKILNTSGIKQIIEEKKEVLLGLIKERNIGSAYDSELAISEVMIDLPSHCPDVIDRLKQGAFISGVDIDSVLYAGSIYLRNLIFKDLGFSLEELDKPRTADGK